MKDAVLSSVNSSNQYIQSCRLLIVDALKIQMIVVFSDGIKHEQIISDKTSELEKLLLNDALDIPLIEKILAWMEEVCKIEFNNSIFETDSSFLSPILQQIKSMLLKQSDAPFLYEDYELLQKTYLHIRHIQELKSSIKQRLESGIDTPMYYRTDIVSREWIQDNRDSLQKLMTAFEKA